MKRRKLFKLDQQIVSTEQRLAAMRSISSGWPVGGEMFFLTAPFREPLATAEDQSAISSLFKASVRYDSLRNGIPYLEQVQGMEQDRGEAKIRYHLQRLTKLGNKPDMHGQPEVTFETTNSNASIQYAERR